MKKIICLLVGLFFLNTVKSHAQSYDTTGVYDIVLDYYKNNSYLNIAVNDTTTPVDTNFYLRVIFKATDLTSISKVVIKVGNAKNENQWASTELAITKSNGNYYENGTQLFYNALFWNSSAVGDMYKASRWVTIDLLDNTNTVVTRQYQLLPSLLNN